MIKIIVKLFLLGRKILFDRMCENMNEWKQLLLYTLSSYDSYSHSALLQSLGTQKQLLLYIQILQYICVCTKEKNLN